jgi:uncharacterized protein (TIGR03083 family)
MRPAELLLRTTGGCDIDPERLLDVFVEQRQRFVAVLEGFGPDDWAAPTRCADWSAQDVVRHLCDANSVMAGTVAHRLDVAGGFDPRTTPREWLSASIGESPGDTLGRFVATTEEAVACGRARLADGQVFDVQLPYGQLDWTVLALHVYWDSWIHERDVLLARGAEHSTDDDATVYATAYGLFIAAVVASMFGAPVDANLKLGGIGGGAFDLVAGGGSVALTAERTSTAGPNAGEITDALAGRSQITDALADLPTETRTALSSLAEFFNTPVE